MPYRKTTFINQHIYHVYNRGVEKRKIFLGDGDYQRFLQTLYYYQFSGPKPKFSTYKRFRSQDFNKNPKIIEIICYCLMPNHFHLLLKQIKTGGIQEFVRKSLNSYTKYFNTKYKRVGPLLQGEFKDVFIETDEQLSHISRYIHLNPYVSNLTNDPRFYPYSSYAEFIDEVNDGICVTDSVLDLFKSPKEYIKFIDDQKDYARVLEQIKDLTLEDHTPGV